nr:hypothetical protein GCM10020185_66850 [Pseudomonas brassicacearum subsp. brassicacearum]
MNADTCKERTLNAQALTDREFGQFQSWLYQAAGISLSEAKKALVAGRLFKRLKHYGLDSYGEYFKLIMNGQRTDELQVALDLLTTNETYFFSASPSISTSCASTCCPMRHRARPSACGARPVHRGKSPTAWP